MQLRRAVASFGSLVTLVYGTSNSHAQIVAVESTYNPGGTYYSFPIDSTYGWKFSVGDAPISVSQLGFFDVGLDGFVDSHAVGIWDASGNVMVQSVVPAGTTAPLNGSYRFTLVDPTTLAANTTYYIGGHSPQPNDTAIMSGPPQTYASEITYLGSTYSQVSGFSPATTSFGGSHGAFGPNFEFETLSAVPEPEHYALGMGVLLLGVAVVRKTRVLRFS